MPAVGPHWTETSTNAHTQPEYFIYIYRQKMEVKDPTAAGEI